MANQTAKSRRSRKSRKPARKRKANAADSRTSVGSKVPSKKDPLAWLNEYEEMSVKERNKAMRDSKKVLFPLVELGFEAGDQLIRPLAAEYDGDRDEGEHAYLTVLRPIRERIVREYNIKTAVEFMVLDALMLSYYQYIRAATFLHQYTAYGKSFNYETLVRYAQQHLAKANDLFLRNLQALREMKSSPITIKIEQAGQVNVGDRQLNVAAETPSETDEGGQSHRT